MVTRDPHVVLGVQAGASSATIKAAWRRLARENHPDLTGDDPAASRVATRRMAEINDAYAALVRSGDATSDGRRRPDGTPFDGEPPVRRGGPPTPKPTRPVTGRVDTSSTYRPRNHASSDRSNGVPLAGQPPLRADLAGREAPRASDPNGPLVRDRLRGYRRPKPPSLEDACAHVLAFGKFHGHTLGQVAAFEPSYVDWLVGTVMRDPEMAASARVVQADLDRRGVQRRRHPTVNGRGG
jgi:DnaJ domain